MPAPFHFNKLELIGDQLTAGVLIEEITISQHCSPQTVYQIQQRLHVTEQATPLIDGLRCRPTRMITPEIKEVMFLPMYI